jgi:hypothetical protein
MLRCESRDRLRAKCALASPQQRNGTARRVQKAGLFVPAPSWSASRCCGWRKRAGSTLCRCARTLSSGSRLSERRDRAYGGKPGFPIGSSASGKLHDRMDPSAGQRRYPWRLGQVPYRPQSDPRSRHRLASRHGTRAHPDRWSGHYPEMARRFAGAAWSQARASGSGTN